ncbi:right-handed parallel beta-helix repeat-containing protein [Novosphingobium huizhouense]|uniref:right-handed parallel beta-helix repeat-containing protein n=1 Tax=Novosphingobium huizhouense TaxID=2866625 RepID=UPI0021E5CF20|nr:right-handed parallel beta-helix repeat-containing protein [Novosphingobium huizhouense]
MTDFQVNSASALTTALRAAQAGDTVYLASGTYSAVSLLGFNFGSGGVKVASADAANPAELLGLKVTQSSGLTFSGVVLKDVDATTDYDFQVKDSSKIVFDNIKLVGQEGDAGYTANPFMIRSSTDVTVRNSSVSHVRYGINMLDNKGVTIANNTFRDIRTDGVRGGGNSDILITGNKFTDFFPAAGDHPDAIQFWTTNTTAVASNITITNNLVMRGNGTPMQGIFMRDESTKLPFTNVVISGNEIIGGLYNGIAVSNASNLKITNNIVAGYADQKSWISVNNPLEWSGNGAQIYMVNGKQVATPVGNLALSVVSDGGSALYSLWQSLGGGALTSSLLASLSGSLDTGSLAVNINGTTGNDNLAAPLSGDSVLNGLAGDDWLSGGAGNTRMVGGLGNDTYVVASSRDVVVELAGEGTDTVITSINYKLPDNVEKLQLAAEGLTVTGNALDNQITGSAGIDTIYGGAGNDGLDGQAGNDTLFGDAGNDRLTGGAGNDTMYGGDGNDTLIGGTGNDTFFGGAGNDTLDAGAGNNLMWGEGGADQFLFRKDAIGFVSVINDFNAAEGDRISLSLIDANTKTTADDPFKFIGTRAFTGHAGELRYVVSGTDAKVMGDVNGDKVADFTIILHDVTSIDASFFIL